MSMLLKVSRRRIREVAKMKLDDALLKERDAKDKVREAKKFIGRRFFLDSPRGKIEFWKTKVERYKTLIRHLDKDIEQDEWLSLDELVELGL